MTPDTGDQQARARFQSGLLTWLRAAAPQEHANGLREMIAVTRGLAAAEGSAGDGLLWRSAGSFLQALLDGSLNTDQEARALCRRLERHLASRQGAAPSRRESADALADALFDFVSNRIPGSHGDTAPPATGGGLDSLLAGTLGATADLLPLLGNAKPRRLSEQQLARWKSSVADLRRDWHAVQTGERNDCRAASIALLQLALELADAPSLRLAEAFAEAGGAAEDPVVLAQPAFRAAFAAALEVAEHADGPDQKGFDDSANAVASRLSQSARPPLASAGLVCASAPWFADDAHETLTELTAALDAVPPKRLALLAGFDWFIQHDAAKVMAIRGLATTAHRIIGQIRTDDLDQADTHATVGRCIAALRHAVDELSTGLPAKADEAVFAELRALERQIAEQRQQAIASARAAKEIAAPPSADAPLQ